VHMHVMRRQIEHRAIQLAGLLEGTQLPADIHDSFRANAKGLLRSSYRRLVVSSIEQEGLQRLPFASKSVANAAGKRGIDTVLLRELVSGMLDERRSIGEAKP
jgi:hypothetical protein